MDNIRSKLQDKYLKLLKAHARRKMQKAHRLYEKVLALQLEMTNERRGK